MKRIILIAALAAFFAGEAYAQQAAGSPEGGISAEMLSEISKGYEGDADDKAIRNALAGSSIATLAVNADNAAMIAIAGWFHYQNGSRSSLDVAPVSRLAEF